MNTSFMKGFYKMTKEELALESDRSIKKEYPLADCTLDYDEAWKLWLAYGWQHSVQMPESML